MVGQVAQLYGVPEIILDVYNPDGKGNRYQLAVPGRAGSYANLYYGSTRERRTNQEMYHFLKGLIVAKEISNGYSK